MSNKNSLEGAKLAYLALDDKLAEDIRVLDISKISTLCDYFVIASGSNSNQLKAMADAVDEKLYKAGFVLKHTEGIQTHNRNWGLMDFGDIVVHLFHKDDREFYSLERIWGDARELTVDELTATQD
ncbi:MAG: ribosome silencing factor [Eubacterium sp.]|nr:ribosome silencing factor [Eubacterium sp.]